MKWFVQIIFIVVLSLLCLRASAQRPTADEIYGPVRDYVDYEDRDTIRWKHNIRIGVGSPSLMSQRFLEGPERSITDNSRYTASDELARLRYYESATYYLSGVTAEYSQTVNPWMSVGGKLSYAMLWRSVHHVHTDELLYRDNNYAVAAILDFRFEWLRRDVVQMYSSVGVGLAARFAFNNGKLSPMYDMTFVGISVGRAVYGYVEFGGGISGLFRAGIGCRF